MSDLFNIDLLDDDDPFEFDKPVPHLFKHLDAELLNDIWWNDPMFFPADPPADWLMVANVAGEIYVAALAPSAKGDPTKCRPIGLDVAKGKVRRKYLAGEEAQRD